MGKATCVIDGSQGEGGGQILRTSLALAAITGRPIRVDNVRAGRKRPGLLRQHLTAVQAVATVSGAAVSGASLGSAQLEFRPGAVRPGSYSFAVGSAGSACLVLQTVLPPLWGAGGPSTVTLEGGTHNPMAPPLDFLERCFLPLLARMGVRVGVRPERAGFYPAGGGRFHVTVEPCARLVPLELRDGGPVRARRARALLANLPEHIGERELAAVRDRLGWRADECRVERVASPGPGNALLLEVERAHVTEVCTAFGERGVRAETVAERAASELERYLASGAPVGEHLADQLLIPLALAGRGAYRTLAPSLHTRTNIAVIRALLDVEVRLEEAPGGCVIRVG